MISIINFRVETSDFAVRSSCQFYVVDVYVRTSKHC